MRPKKPRTTVEGDLFRARLDQIIAGLDPGPALVAVERRDLVIDPVPVDLADEVNQLIPHIDDRALFTIPAKRRS